MIRGNSLNPGLYGPGLTKILNQRLGLRVKKGHDLHLPLRLADFVSAPVIRRSLSFTMFIQNPFI